MRSTRTAILAIMIAAWTGCARASDHGATAVTEVRSADSAWAAAFARKDLPGYLAFVDSGATIQQPNGPPVHGVAAIRGLIEGFFGLRDLSGTWQPSVVVAAGSGDLAYSTGTYALSYADSTGHRITEQGKYLEVWRRHQDGRWRMIVESFNADHP